MHWLFATVVVRLRAVAPINPSEDAALVGEAANKFVEGEPQVLGESVVVEGMSLNELRRRIWELRIIDTFRGALREVDGELQVSISKQAALAGRISLPAREHALGEIALTITLDESDPWQDIEALRWWLCPETADGEIVGDYRLD